MSGENNKILFSETNHIKIEQIDLLTANSSFKHIDRIAQMNVMIYVLSGCIYVSEEDQDFMSYNIITFERWCPLLCPKSGISLKIYQKYIDASKPAMLFKTNLL